jgi:phosphoserine phosphatase
MAPLARALSADGLIAASLAERNGRFTGRLTGPPVGEKEKARRVTEYAEAQGIDLAASYAYGDSVADAPMLEIVGRPNAVNPDKRLSRLAAARGWPVRRWGGVSAEKEHRRCESV